MTAIAWPSSPLIRVTSLFNKGGPLPQYESEWAVPTEFKYKGVHDPITFYVEFVSDSSAGTHWFRIGVETVDENDNTIQVVHPTQEYAVSNAQPKTFTLAVPLPGLETRFKVTIEVLKDKTKTGTWYWEAPESRIYVAKLTKCFIATAAYGSELASPVQFLREFRDDVLLKSRYSSLFEKLFDVYYRFSPPIAKAMVRSKPFKYVMKYIVVWPVVATVGASAFIIKLFVDNKKGPASR